MKKSGLGLVWCTIAVSLWFALSSGPAAAIEQDPDADTFAAYEFRADPVEGRVDVTITLEVTADKPNRSTSNGTVQYFFESYSIIIPSDGEDLTITDGAGRSLEYVVEQDFGDAELITIDFRRNVFYRQTGTTIISFTYRGGEPRSTDFHRINDAYVGFSMWGDPLLEGASFTVVAPEAFEDVDDGLVRFAREVIDGEQHFTVDIDDVEQFWATASLTHDASMVTTDVEAAGHRIELQAWPSDTAWAEHVTDSLENGLPQLIDVVGLDWPIGDELEIVESYSPYIHGYAGWYDSIATKIEIGDELDEHLVYHELSHVWFNDDLFYERWITEGLADAFAAEVVESRGNTRPEPESISLLDGEALPLNAWDLSAPSDEREFWAYGASWTVTEAIVDEVGIDVLTEVVEAAAAEELSYLGDGSPERFSGRQDWMYYLDLIENRSGATGDDVTELFIDWVARSIDVDRIEQRIDGRESYHALVDAGGDWAPPLGVRRAMSGWRFNDASDLMAEAGVVLASRDELLDRIEVLGAAMPSGLEAAYERSSDNYEDATDQLAEATTVADRLVATDLARSEADNPLEWIGAIGTTIDTDLAAAVDDFEAGLFATATEKSDRLDEQIDGLSGTGLLRLAIAVVVLITLVLATWFIGRRRGSGTAEARTVAFEGANDADPSDPVTANEAPEPTLASTSRPERLK